MALLPYNLEIVKQLLPYAPTKPVEMLCLGYPDVIVPPQTIRNLFGDSIADAVKYREDSSQVLKWHGMDDSFGGVPETAHFFSMLGVHITVIDIAASRGGELIVDLNQPAPPEYANRFDLVLDAGTLEHCFNIAQAISNVLSMAKVHGFICHDNPFNVPNHGFYNFNPTFYHDFYTDNGHQVVGNIRVIWKTGEGYHSAEPPPTGRFNFSGHSANISMVARKLHSSPIIWPMQTKYKANPTLKGQA